jgi:hypothetical protein
VLAEAGITTVKQVRDSSFDIRATSLNRLYVELLKDNPEWGTACRHDMNHFMARLIFCFFAHRTDIFTGDDLFTATIEQMSVIELRPLGCPQVQLRYARQLLLKHAAADHCRDAHSARWSPPGYGLAIGR